MRERTTIPFTDGGKYRLLGRALQTADGVICDWSADGLEFTADCEGGIEITACTTDEPTKTTLKFRVIVDGVAGEQVWVKPGGEVTAVAFRDIAPGVHTIRIVKDTQVYVCTDLLKSVTLRCEPGSVKATEKKDKMLLVIGDSDTCGYGVIPTDMPETTWESSSAILSYGYRAAAALGLDYAFVCKGTLGVLKKAGAPVPHNYPEMFEYQNPWRDPGKKYAFPRKADAILMKVSGNDNAFSDAEMGAALKDFIGTLRKYHGADVPILLFIFEKSKRQELLAAMCAEDPYLRVVNAGVYGGRGMGRHATAEAHAGFAEKVVEAIKGIMN